MLKTCYFKKSTGLQIMILAFKNHKKSKFNKLDLFATPLTVSKAQKETFFNSHDSFK
jgi:hypothetical protein